MQRSNPATVTLNDILMTEELSRRSSRAPNLQAENQAMRMLIHKMAGNSETLLQTLVDIALELCQAGTAGVSLLETTRDGEGIFRWNALAGTLAHHMGGITPCGFSPCGVCLDQGSPVLFSHPERYFTYFQDVNTPIVEGLVLPLIADGHTLGTIWIMSHDEQRHFDSEDVRVMRSLADFTATALLLQQRQTRELLAANAALEAEIVERRQAEEQTRALVSNLPGGAAFVVDRNLHYLLAEGEALATAGFKPEDFVGRTIFEALPPDLAASYEPLYRQALADEPFEYEHHAHNHTYISHGTPLRTEDGEIYAVLAVSYDITERKRLEDERKRTEEALRESEAKLALELADARQLQFISSQLVQEENIDALYAQILEAAIALMRSEMGSMQMLHPDCNQLQLLAWKGFDPASAAFWEWVRVDSESTCGMALRTGERSIVPDVETCEWMADSGDLDAYRRSGVRAVQTTPLVSRSGRIVGMISTHWREPHQPSERELGLLDVLARQAADLIEQRQAEGALRESEAKYRSLFDSIDAGFCIFEMLYNDADEAIDFRYIETNPAFEWQSGRRPQPGQTMRELFPEAEDMWLKDYAEVARTGQPKRFIDYHEDLDRWFDVFVFPTSNGKNQLAALFSDVTEEKRSEAALRESEERLQKAISIETVGVLFFTLDGRITDANDTFLRMSGYSRDELCTIADWQELTPPEFWDATSVAAEELATLGKTAPYEKQHIRKDGSRWWGLFSPTRLKGSGRHAECVEFVIDISEAKRVEDERKQTEAQLQRVAQMDAFRIKLADALRSLSDAPEIQRATMRILGEHLQVDRVMYAEIDDGETYSIAANYVRGAYPTLVGRFPTSDFGTVSEQLRAGETFAVENMTTDERLSEAARAAFIALDVYASVGVPLIKAGRWVANLGIQHGQARQWTEEDIELVQETAERTWAAVERARAEAALRDSEQRLSIIFAQAAVGLSEISLDGHFEQVNDALCRMLGRSRQELLAATVPEVTHPEDVPKSLDALAQLLETGGSISLDKRYLRPDGTVLWANSMLTRLDDEQGQPRHILAVTLDVGDRKQAEAERLQRIQEQSAREEERQRAVREAARSAELAELDRAKTLFFSNVSHEFRTPLTLSLAPLQDALSDRVHPLAPVHRERLELVHRNSLRLLKLVNTLLDFSRIEAGRRSAVYEPTDLAMFTAELSSVFRSAIERAGLQLIVDCPPLPEPVFVDREMWEKIVLNLLSNAFKFTFEGEIRVSLHSTDSSQAVLQIQDTGAGIAPEHLPHLFERFYQVRGTQARTHERSGIGLALVHELVRLQGGTIEVSSTLGEGTCFMIALPFGTDHLPQERIHANRTLISTAIGAAAYVEEAERWLPIEENRKQTIGTVEEHSPATSDSSLPTSASARVLVVDDNTDMREYLSRILSEHVQVEACADGVTALAAAQARVPDLILSDVMMPGLDGFGLLQALRADPRTREVPIILLSARAGEEAVVEGLAAGADDYLIKPFSAQELLSRVKSHLQMAQLRSEALQEARTSIRTRDEMISTVFHELNTPLVAILGWTRLLRDAPASPSMLTKALNTIERNAALQAKLVQDLLDISRITAGKLHLNLQPVELEAVIETAIAAVETAAIAKNIHLHWQMKEREKSTRREPYSVWVLGDRDRLQQVLCNLFTNAIKFTPEFGSVTVKLSMMDDGKFPNAAYAQVEVADTGIGISPEFLPHVFDRFRQAEGSNAGKGLGLGLAIAHHLVELHNGMIYAYSAGNGQGATFIVRLPLLETHD